MESTVQSPESGAHQTDARQLPGPAAEAQNLFINTKHKPPDRQTDRYVNDEAPTELANWSGSTNDSRTVRPEIINNIARDGRTKT